MRKTTVVVGLLAWFGSAACSSNPTSPSSNPSSIVGDWSGRTAATSFPFICGNGSCASVDFTVESNNVADCFLGGLGGIVAAGVGCNPHVAGLPPSGPGIPIQNSQFRYDGGFGYTI